MKQLTYDDEYESDTDNDVWNDVNVDDNLLLRKGKPRKQRFYHWTPKNRYSLFMALLLYITIVISIDHPVEF